MGFSKGAQTVDVVAFLGYIAFLALTWDFIEDSCASQGEPYS